MTDYSPFKPANPNRRMFLIIGGVVILVGALVGIIILVTRGKAGPAVATATSSPPPTLTATVSRTPTEGPPTQTLPPSATPTLEPYQYVVQQGDTLYYIIGLFGYRTLDIVPEIIALNGMSNENDLQANETILIPRQTPTPGPTLTPTPTPGEGTPTLDPNFTPEFQGCSVTNRCMSQDGQYWMHEVVEGETCVGLAIAYDTRTEDIARDNNLGADCYIYPGQILRILIRVTLTPTLTPTGGPDSTATPTPTLSPPALLAPANGATIARNQTVALQWVANEPLWSGAYYLVQIRNVETGDTTRMTTRSTVFRLPESLLPGAGQSIQYEWRVVIVGQDDTNATVISGQNPDWTFTWGP